MTREEAISYFESHVEIMETPPIHLRSAVSVVEWAKRCDHMTGAYRWAISALREQGATDTNVGHKTNADRIRAMSDEELVMWIAHTGAICETCAYMEWCDGPTSGIYCESGIRDWLKQPCKEETT